MKRALKWVFLLLILLPLLFILLFWAIWQLTPQEKVRAWAAREVGQAINRQVQLGPIHWNLNGLEVEEIRLSEIPTFKAGTLFFAKGVRLGWGLRTLWQGLDMKKKWITRSSGHFHIADFQNPHYTAHDFSLRWSLSEMDSTWSRLNGWVKLEQGAGLLQNVDQLIATSPSAKIALTPVLALMNLDRMGLLNLGLPDLRHWPIDGIRGDYAFQNGRMTIERLTIDGQRLSMATTGTVELGSGGLQLQTQLHSARRALGGALDATLRISGTTSHPKVDLESLKKKAFQATLKHLLQDPAGVKKDIDKTLQNLFH